MPDSLPLLPTSMAALSCHLLSLQLKTQRQPPTYFSSGFLVCPQSDAEADFSLPLDIMDSD